MPVAEACSLRGLKPQIELLEAVTRPNSADTKPKREFRTCRSKWPYYRLPVDWGSQYAHSTHLIDTIRGVWARNIRPMRLSRRPQPFDSEEFIFELKIDGWRALAVMQAGQCNLVPRNGNAFRRFVDLRGDISQRIPDGTVLDGEICCLDEYGRSIFNDLMSRDKECFFYAFDALFVAGEDVRSLPLIRRKEMLRKLIRTRRSRLLFMDHIETHGTRLFERACDLDLEGIVAKRKISVYQATEKPSAHWIKIKNPAYTQAQGRAEMFEQMLQR